MYRQVCDNYSMNNSSTHMHCPQCERDVRITEPYAFGGRDKLRATLACGHIVSRGDV